MYSKIDAQMIPYCHTRCGSIREIVCKPKNCLNKKCNFRHEMIEIEHKIRNSKYFNTQRDRNSKEGKN